MAKSSKEYVAAHRRRKVYAKIIHDGGVKVTQHRDAKGKPGFYIETDFTPEGWQLVEEEAERRGMTADDLYREILRYLLENDAKRRAQQRELEGLPT